MSNLNVQNKQGVLVEQCQKLQYWHGFPTREGLPLNLSQSIHDFDHKNVHVRFSFILSYADTATKPSKTYLVR